MPVNFARVYEEELETIAARRERRLGEKTCKKCVQRDLFGICFSGGGIRSATFNLGVLQGLASHGLLELCDYLSTVSGGGYIGGWFEALSCRAGKTLGGRTVEEYLSAQTAHPEPASKDPITFLRKYSNYLAPQLGLTSPDTWVIFSIWLRNMLLNQLVFLLVLTGLLLCPLVLGNLAGLATDLGGSFTGWMVAVGLPVILALAWAVVRMGTNIKLLVKREFPPFPADAAPDDDGSVWSKVIAPVFVSALLLSVLIASDRFHPVRSQLTGLIMGAALLVLFTVSLMDGGYSECYNARHARRDDKRFTLFKKRSLGTAIIVFSAAVCAALLTGFAHLLPVDGSNLSVWVCVTLGPPLLIMALACGVGLQVGLMGVDFADSAREWYSRLAAKILISSVCWVIVFGIVVFAPLPVLWFFQHHPAAGTATTLTWLLTTFAGFQAGKSPSTKGTPPVNSAAPKKRTSALEIVAKVAPPLAILGLLVAVSTASFWAIENAPNLAAKRTRPEATKTQQTPESSARSMTVTADGPGEVDVKWTPPSEPGFWTAFASDPHSFRALNLDTTSNWKLFGAALFLMLLSYLLSTRININEFSMNHFYKNRLVRCYLGASHGAGRSPNSFTGFDPHDDVPLTELMPSRGYFGPYPIFNCALNLNHGSELAWQERKASSFIFTPNYCGYQPVKAGSDGVGYVPTDSFTGSGGPHIGLATAISGAAANPNWGYHTSPVTAFLMTIFNVRLGWWVGNTKNSETAIKPGPPFALKYLFYELLGMTNEDSDYLNLSDGGHFENLGIYELLRRKCRFIIVGDGEQDENYVFESLGGAIRKARIDFGINVDISPRRIFIKEDASEVHCATGDIFYPDGSGGKLLYIKSSITGDESYDVSQYKKLHGGFPHESTMNQFFTESQFESYRALGRHCVEKAFSGTTPVRTHEDLSKSFEQLATNWLPPAV